MKAQDAFEGRKQNRWGVQMWLVHSPKVSFAHFAFANQIHLFDSCLKPKGEWISETSSLKVPIFGNPGKKFSFLALGEKIEYLELCNESKEQKDWNSRRYTEKQKTKALNKKQIFKTSCIAFTIDVVMFYWFTGLPPVDLPRLDSVSASLRPRPRRPGGPRGRRGRRKGMSGTSTDCGGGTTNWSWIGGSGGSEKLS